MTEILMKNELEEKCPAETACFNSLCTSDVRNSSGETIITNCQDALYHVHILNCCGSNKVVL